MCDENDKVKCGAVDLAYPIAVSSSDYVLRALDSVDGRLQTSLTLVVTATGVALGFFADRVIQFHSRWFYAAMVTFGLTVLIGIAGRLIGDAVFISPSVLNGAWLDSPACQFKKEMIYYSGRAFDKNAQLSHRKWLMSLVMQGFFLLEMAFLVCWAVSHHRA